MVRKSHVQPILKNIDLDARRRKRSKASHATSQTFVIQVDHFLVLTLHVLIENQLREKTHKWLSPPDPSTNHNIACATHHKGTATWFLEGNIFQQWKTRGSLLWIHGKRVSCYTFFQLLSDDILILMT